MTPFHQIPIVLSDLPLLYQTPKIEFYWNEKASLLVSWAKKFSSDN
jgi:hypothetical protein